MFDLLQVPPALGRSFRAEEDAPGKDAVIILSHGMWQRRFGGDPGILGRAITLSGTPVTVIGVMPAGFAFMADVGVLAAAGAARQSDARRTLPRRDRAAEARRDRPSRRARR